MSKIVDLTLPIEQGMPTFPASWHSPVEITTLGRLEVEGRNTRELRLGTHTGTHIDAPLHFVKNGMTIDEIPIGTTVGRAVLVDLGMKGPLEAITEAELRRKQEQISSKGIAVLRTGWARFWGKPEFYGQHPYITSDAAAWLVEKEIRALGMDLPDVEEPASGTVQGVPGPRHLQLLGNGIILIENLNNLSELDEGVFFLIALPLRITGADAAPARVIAIQDPVIE